MKKPKSEKLQNFKWLKVIKAIRILSLILILFILIRLYIRMFFSWGGCYISTEVSDIQIPENLNIEVKPISWEKTCVPRFRIVNYEENLTFYAIRGDVPISGDAEEDMLSNVLICLNDTEDVIWRSSYSRKYVHPVQNAKSCPPIDLDLNDIYYIDRIENYWELITNKGIIKGRVEYRDSTDSPIMIVLGKIYSLIPKIILIKPGFIVLIFISTFIIPFIYKKMKSN